VLRFRLMVKRGPHSRPQASEGEAQHGPFCWIGRIGDPTGQLEKRPPTKSGVLILNHKRKDRRAAVSELLSGVLRLCGWYASEGSNFSASQV